MTSSGGRNEWLEVAAAIGARVVRQAQWSGDACYWNVWVSQGLLGVREGRPAAASGNLYQGTSGIGLFLAELYRATTDPQFEKAAVGALNYSTRVMEDAPPWSCGFHSGRVGLAFALARLAVATRDDKHLAMAREWISPISGTESAKKGSDVIAGAAGAIPALLAISDELGSQPTMQVARAMGDALVRRARRAPIGWSWGGLPTAVHDLTGYAHGASGYAHAFLELFAATGDGWYRYAAEQACLYERQFFSAEEGNWPDFRYSELAEYVSYGHIGALRERQRGQSPIPPYRRSLMSAWCHGAPGIGLVRLRAWEVLKDAIFLSEARTAVETTARSIGGSLSTNYSLCHGFLGNCETLLYASQVFGESRWRQMAEDCAASGAEQFERKGRRWPCGTVGGVPDPSLMLGEAGIGHFFLRLYDSTIPAVLFITSRSKSVGAAVRDPKPLRREHVGTYFATSLRVLDQTIPGGKTFEAQATHYQGAVVSTFDRIRHRIETEENLAVRTLLEDAFAVERARFELDRDFAEASDQLIDAFVRPTVSELDWETVELQLSPNARLVRTSRDWTEWAAEDGLPKPSDVPVTTVVVRGWTSGRVVSRRLQALGSLVLQCTRQRGTISEIIGRVLPLVDAPDETALREIVVEHLKAAYAAAIVSQVQQTLVPPVSKGVSSVA